LLNKLLNVAYYLRTRWRFHRFSTRLRTKYFQSWWTISNRS